MAQTTFVTPSGQALSIERVRSEITRIWFSDTAPTRIWCGHISVFAGLLVGLGILNHAPPFALLGHLMPLSIWGLWFGGWGVLQVAAAWFKRYRLPLVTAFVGALNWLYLVYASFQIDAHSLVLVLYAAVALMWWWEFMRIPRKRVV